MEDNVLICHVNSFFVKLEKAMVMAAVAAVVTVAVEVVAAVEVAAVVVVAAAVWADAPMVGRQVQ